VFENALRSPESVSDSLLKPGYRLLPTSTSPTLSPSPTKGSTVANDAAAFASFMRQVLVAAGGLAVLVFVATRGIPQLRLDLALMAVALMGMNAIAAIGPLYWFANRNPMHVYMISLMVRMAGVGAFTLALVLPSHFTMTDALSFVLTAMLAFVAYTALEVRHLIRHQPTLFSR
jgi:hypothetical protein